MPRNGSGTYTLPTGNPVSPGTTIESAWANTTLSDIGTELTNSLSRTGAGGMLAAFRLADGTLAAPGVAFLNETGTGLYRAGSGEMWTAVQGIQIQQYTVNGVLIPSSKTFTAQGDSTLANLAYTGTLTGGTGVVALGTNQFYKDASGNVGIGTATPAYKLDVVGDMALKSNATYLRGTTPGGASVRLLGINGANTAYVGPIDTGPVDMLLNAASSSTNMQFYASGSEQMRLTSTGLGIGTASPVNKLHISGTYGAGDLTGSIRVENQSFTSGSYAGMLFKTADGLNSYVTAIRQASFGGILAFGTNDGSGASAIVERARLDSAGNLGLGVPPSAWFASSKVIQIGNSAFEAVNAETDIYANAYRTVGNTFEYLSTNFATQYKMISGQHQWYTAPSGTAGNAISFTQAMTLDASGRLLVGTTTAAGMLTVSAPASTGYGSFDAVSQGFATLTFKVNGTTLGYFGCANAMITGGSATQTGIRADGDLLFATGGGTERARITSGGDLLVGDTNGGLQNSYSTNFTKASGYWTVNHASGSPDTRRYFYFGYNGTEIGSITQSGTTAVAYNTSSDYRLKDNPQPLTGSGAFIDALQPKTWDWKADGSRGVGFLAHEAQAVSPRSVVGDKDAVDEDGKPIMQAMEYGSAEFIANIIAELQSLRARVASLEA